MRTARRSPRTTSPTSNGIMVSTCSDVALMSLTLPVPLGPSFTGNSTMTLGRLRRSLSSFRAVDVTAGRSDLATTSSKQSGGESHPSTGPWSMPRMVMASELTSLRATASSAPLGFRGAVTSRRVRRLPSERASAGPSAKQTSKWSVEKLWRKLVKTCLSPTTSTILRSCCAAAFMMTFLQAGYGEAPGWSRKLKDGIRESLM